MKQEARVRSSEYMQWAKMRSQARFNLSSSGLAHFPLAKLPVTLEELEISGPTFYGYEPLQRLLAEKSGVSTDCVVAATGTSMANHLAMASLIESGEEVLIEHPTYELLLSLARYLSAEVKRFSRSFENGFRIDLREIERAVTERTRLIVLTNLHNPSSTLTDSDTLKQIGELARSVGARVLVDEVYLDAAFDLQPRSAFHLGEEFITTNSLTKVYGLSGLRCGWILAEPKLAERIWRLNDLFGVNPSHTAELLSCIALKHLDQVASHARTLLETNRQELNRFFDTRDDLEYIKLEYGTVSFPRVKSGNAEDLCALLREKHETSVVPGSFFDMPEHIRIGIGGDTETLKAGLERLG
ncbi:MAG: aminotransferase class I/II-fold pyridoxal phosphate-dependent enzyme, partial [Pyrinomonadaceae bacterium]